MSNKILKKNKRTVITLATKLEILKRFDAGENAVNISKSVNLPITTVKSIRNRDATKIKEIAKNTNIFMSGQILKITSSLHVLMESLLSNWITEQNQQKVPLSRALIQEKARCIFEYLKTKPEHIHKSETFCASRGWFDKFKSRAKLHNLSMKGESASGDAVAAESFQDIIASEGGCSAKQVETDLDSKRFPKKTFISLEGRSAFDFKEVQENTETTNEEIQDVFLNEELGSPTDAASPSCENDLEPEQTSEITNNDRQSEKNRTFVEHIYQILMELPPSKANQVRHKIYNFLYQAEEETHTVANHSGSSDRLDSEVEIKYESP